MKFSAYPYQRPDMEKFELKYSNNLEELINANSFEKQSQFFEHLNQMNKDFDTLSKIVFVRHTINTADEFYDKENNFFNHAIPVFENMQNRFYQAITTSKYRDELEKRWGKQLFVLADLQLKTFKPEIIAELQQESKFRSEYQKLTAKAMIQFNGKERNLSQLLAFRESKDRALRIKATDAYWNFFKENNDQLDEIYDRLVKVRTQIAHKLGYANFIQLGYDRLRRSDYNSNAVENFRHQVKQFIVPITQKLNQRQAKRIGLDKLTFYDEAFRFKTGNAQPLGDEDWLIDRASTMYKELSREADEIFSYMLKHGLMDLKSKKNKRGGGYCRCFANYQSPFIFSNFNGTAADVEVLTHEAGHAFQLYLSQELGILEYFEPTLEVMEIHSMSMEFFTWPWMKLFFGSEENKYKFSHLNSCLTNIPYAAAVDEFQHKIYANPDLTPAKRDKLWRDIEKKYLPDRDYDSNQYLESGTYWKRQKHIFFRPFYYIDYELARICAFQFWKKMNEDSAQAWSDYIKLCQAGGSRSFLSLLKLANLECPFESGKLEKIVTHIVAWLERVDDSQF